MRTNRTTSSTTQRRRTTCARRDAPNAHRPTRTGHSPRASSALAVLHDPPARRPSHLSPCVSPLCDAAPDSARSSPRPGPRPPSPHAAPKPARSRPRLPPRATPTPPALRPSRLSDPSARPCLRSDDRVAEPPTGTATTAPLPLVGVRHLVRRRSHDHAQGGPLPSASRTSASRTSRLLYAVLLLSVRRIRLFALATAPPRTSAP